MPPSHDHHTATAPPDGRPDQPGTPANGHPPWCSPQHCYLDEDGVRVHEQQPMHWEDSEVRFKSWLFLPDDEHPPATYLQLSIDDLQLTWRGVDTFLPITTARRLRDQLTAHLNAADSCPSVQAQTTHDDLTPHGDPPPAAGANTSRNASVRPSGETPSEWRRRTGPAGQQ